MASFRRLVLLVLLGGFALGPVLAQPIFAQQSLRWERYHDEAFEFGLSLPRELLAKQEEAPGQGLTLSSPDGKVVVNVFGAENAEHRPLADIVAEYRSSLPDTRITYEWFGGSSAVLSGFQNGDILYVRIAMSPDRSRVAVLNMLYARDLKKSLDPIVTRLSRSLAFRWAAP